MRFNDGVRHRLIVIVVAVFGVAPVAHAAAPPLPTRLASALAVPQVAPASSGAIAIDLRTYGVVFARNADTPLVPASNEKLTVTFAALRELGPYYRFRTEVIGRGYQDGPTWVGDLVLKGYGDPTLSSWGLASLAAQLREAGIRRVDGRVLGDESWFDARRTVAGWKPGYYLFESPPLSALVVDGDWYHGRLAREPGARGRDAVRRGAARARDLDRGRPRRAALRTAASPSRPSTRSRSPPSSRRWIARATTSSRS